MNFTDAPMQIAVRCRAATQTERTLSQQRFPSRRDTNYDSVLIEYFNNDKKNKNKKKKNAHTTEGVVGAGPARVTLVDPDSISTAAEDGNLALLPSFDLTSNTRKQRKEEENGEDDGEDGNADSPLSAASLLRRDRFFNFDLVFDETASNRTVYEHTVLPLVQWVKVGYNATCFAYGMTGAGKTYTMFGYNNNNNNNNSTIMNSTASNSSSNSKVQAVQGISSMAIADLFQQPPSDDDDDKDDASATLNTCSTATSSSSSTLHVSYLEIYNERIQDLLVEYAQDDRATKQQQQQQQRSTQLSFDNKQKNLSSSFSSGLRQSDSTFGATNNPSNSNQNHNLDVMEDPVKGVFVPGLIELRVSSLEEVEQLVNRGDSRRARASTSSNALSSRSHAVLQFSLRQSKELVPINDEHEADSEEGGTYSDTENSDYDKIGSNPKQLSMKRKPCNGAAAAAKKQREVLTSKLLLIDLAGSERVSPEIARSTTSTSTNATGGGSTRNARQQEGANINRSLLALGNCLAVLGRMAASSSGGPRTTSTKHVPYRDSKLTRLLKESLGGNTRTVMIAAISPSCTCYEETLSTLKYASQAKAITKKVRQNCTVEADEAATNSESNDDDGKEEREREALHAYQLQSYQKTVHSLQEEVACLKAQLYLTQRMNEKINPIGRYASDDGMSSSYQHPYVSAAALTSSSRAEQSNCTITGKESLKGMNGNDIITVIPSSSTYTHNNNNNNSVNENDITGETTEREGGEEEERVVDKQWECLLALQKQLHDLTRKSSTSTSNGEGDEEKIRAKISETEKEAQHCEHTASSQQQQQQQQEPRREECKDTSPASRILYGVHVRGGIGERRTDAGCGASLLSRSPEELPEVQPHPQKAPLPTTRPLSHTSSSSSSKVTVPTVTTSTVPVSKGIGAMMMPLQSSMVREAGRRALRASTSTTSTNKFSRSGTGSLSPTSNRNKEEVLPHLPSEDKENRPQEAHSDKVMYVPPMKRRTDEDDDSVDWDLKLVHKEIDRRRQELEQLPG